MQALAYAFTRLAVADLARSERFYGEVFGLQVTRRATVTHEAYALEEAILGLNGAAPGTSIILTRFDDGRQLPPAGAAWVGFLVPDIQDTAERIVAGGGEVLVPVHENHGVQALHARDPDGHMIAAIQIPAQQGEAR